MAEPQPNRGNPVIPIYAADPDAHHIGDRYYIYATNAGYYESKRSFEAGHQNPDAPARAHGFAAWSSEDLRNWRSEGPILHFADIEWAKDLPNAWAPCLAARNGKYYFYFCADSRIGVAVSDSPTGPFVDPLGRPLIEYRQDLSAIDPMVYTDDDGVSYLYWGAIPGHWLEGEADYIRMHLSVRKLAPDMISFAGEELPTIFTTPSGSNEDWQHGWHDLDHIEASHLTKHKGRYYLQWSAGSFNSADLNRTYRVNYAVANSPIGPWRTAPDRNLQGVANGNPMLASRPEIGVIAPGHHGIITLPGGISLAGIKDEDEHWCVYHAHSGDVDRRVWIDRLRFAEDGTIQPVEPTLEGPPLRRVAIGLVLAAPGPFARGSSIPFRILAHESFARVELFEDDHPVSATDSIADLEPGFHRIHARGTRPDGSIVRSTSVDFDVSA